ncbi:FAD-dependent oxidoreductase [Fodinibius salsisoli]|uniref:FAD-dependent monooxygenase n=1 Tax=Fodinibius salsisoli TaxID=2820877 RepID=A0ABT3PIH3_9BACT|nr:NAD(P)/FAD-dependent oxidoreductase [Fodinibius salsisoli]MCW9705727.1 FAD-dependent monooxygenase [Fodinibius salsisoli]
MQDMDILIIGAGVAGLTCAGLLSRHGLHPQIVEREPQQQFNCTGYMLGLYPLGGRVLNALDARTAYYNQSIQMEYYEAHRSNGALIKSYPLDFINEKYGSYRSITRQKLIDILLANVTPEAVRFDTTVANLEQGNDEVRVTFSEGRSERFDLVIIADGLHSETRDFILDDNEYSYYHTGWGGWVSWLHGNPTTSYKEYWGAGSFLGIYPVKDKVGVFLGGPIDIIKEKGLASFADEVKQMVSPEHELPRQALEACRKDERPFFWDFHDCRTKTWHKGHVVLLGDAATGFLPTAGVGASMAMDSAAALADELSRAHKQHLPYALNLYTQRQKQRVETAQADSRKLAKMIFMKSPVLSKIRNRLLPFYSLQQILSDLSNVMEGRS